MSAQKEVRKPLHPFFRPKLCPNESAATSFGIAILVIGFGGALFSHSFSKVLQMPDCKIKSYLYAAMCVGLFQAIVGFFVTMFEWKEIRKREATVNTKTNSLRWVVILLLIISFAAWIIIGQAISGNSPGTELLESMRLMVICNCVILCMSCVVVPHYTMCLKSTEEAEENGAIVVP